MEGITRYDVNEEWAHSGMIRAGDFCSRGGWDYIRRGSAGNLCETDIAGLGVVRFIVDIDDPLFPVDDRIFSVRGESHDREFAAVALVVFHVIASGLLVCSEEDPDPAF